MPESIAHAMRMSFYRGIAFGLVVVVEIAYSAWMVGIFLKVW